MIKTRFNMKSFSFVILLFPLCQQLMAHNGNIGYAYPLGNIIVDGNFADWHSNIPVYQLTLPNSASKKSGQTDFSSSFRIGYRAENRSIYIALQVTDDDFVEDTSTKASWNTQDAMELYLDARHLPGASGVASFYYSKKLRHTNNAYYDPFAKDAKWNIAEIAFVQKGNTRYYEWRLNLGNEFAIGKTIGIDLQVFDLDSDKSFSVAAWGPGDQKYMNPRSLSDVMLMPASEKLATISGTVRWDKKINVPLPKQVRFMHTQHPQRWFSTVIDSLGNYTAQVPAGKYAVDFMKPYLHQQDTVYTIQPGKPILISAVAGSKIKFQPLLFLLCRHLICCRKREY